MGAPARFGEDNVLLQGVRNPQNWPRSARLPQRLEKTETTMDSLTLFGLIAVTLMLVTYALEARSHWYILAFAGACALGSAYGFLQGAWPFGVVEAVWAVVALRRWMQAKVA
jgi:hypothetical protein